MIRRSDRQGRVGWGQVMESLKGQEEYFEIHALFDGEWRERG